MPLVFLISVLFRIILFRVITRLGESVIHLLSFKPKMSKITFADQCNTMRSQENRLITPTTRLFIQQFLEGPNIENYQQRNHQSSASLALCSGIYRWSVNPLTKGQQCWSVSMSWHHCWSSLLIIRLCTSTVKWSHGYCYINSLPPGRFEQNFR